MAEPLKTLYDRSFVNKLAKLLVLHDDHFDEKAFVKSILNKEWKDFELKQRMRHVTLNLGRYLPCSYNDALQILKPVSLEFSGLVHLVFPDYVECYGLEHEALSVEALAYFTEGSSSEFAIRPFIIKKTETMMKTLLDWADSENEHVRRLASEGCRPRLPWAMALPEFKNDPSPIWPILEKLMDDKSLYVRKSVANNLNDISKDHPKQVVDFAKKWIGTSKETDWILKHGARTLLKQAHSEAMAIWGYSYPDHVKLTQFKCLKYVEMGETLKFEFSLRTNKKSLGLLRLEFAVDFMKSNGQLSRKVFKISESVVKDSIKFVEKSFSFKPITTRRYYPGLHKLAIIVNGEELASRSFKLKK